MDDKEACERLVYLEYRLAKRLSKMDSVTERLGFLILIFGRNAREEYERLRQSHPELIG